MATAKARNYPSVHQQGATDRSIYSMGYLAAEKNVDPDNGILSSD